MELDLLMTDQGIYLHNVPYVTVPARKRKESNGTKRNAFHFTHLDADQKLGLKDLLAHHVG